MCFLLSVPMDSPLSVAVSTHLRFVVPAVSHSMGHAFDCTVILFSPLVSPISELYLLRLLLTSYSSLLLQQMRPSVRPHGISLPVFPRLLAGSTYMVYGFLLNFAALSQLIHHVRLVSGFCPPSYDFAIPSSRLYLTI